MLETELKSALARFGLSGFRPGQREIIESVIAGRPTIAVLPTGAGKSLCYQLPPVAMGGLGVVVSPLISLMKDQVDALGALGIPATFINSTIDGWEKSARLEAAARGDLRLLYVAPERFRVPGFIAELARAKPVLLAIDEAHCISQWGHDFRPDYARLGEVVAALKPPRLCALTATATPDVRAEIAAQLGMRDPLVFVRGFDRPNLHLSVEAASGDDDKLKRVLRLLDADAALGRPALVYTATRKKAASVAQELRDRRISARAYHAGLEDTERAEVQEQWTAGQVRVVVATNAFGMGVDKRDVRVVVHHDLPGSAEAYYQEAGRAGRDGEPARCVLLFNHSDVRLREFLITAAGDGPPKSERHIAAERERLRGMMSYAYGRGCRRRYLLGWFGDPDADGPCAGCDVCDERAGAAPLDDPEHLMVRKVLATVARLDGRYGRHKIALVLEGSESKEVLSAQLDRLSTYGVLHDRSHSWVLDLLGSLEAAGLLVATGDDYPVLSLSALGREVMHDRARAQIALPRQRRERKSRSAEVPADLEVDAPTFEKLRGLRAKLAAEAKLPAYCIFHDRTLIEMARTRPQTLFELAQVTGVGPSKLEKYGAAVLEALAP